MPAGWILCKRKNAFISRSNLSERRRRQSPGLSLHFYTILYSSTGCSILKMDFEIGKSYHFPNYFCFIKNGSISHYHSVEILGFFCHLDFTWNQLLENVEALRLLFLVIRGLKFVDLVNFSLHQVNNFKKVKIDRLESTNLISRKILVIEISEIFQTGKLYHVRDEFLIFPVFK